MYKMTTRIIFLLDSSSSMFNDRERTISARNELIIDQQNVEIANEDMSPKFTYYTFSNVLSSPKDFMNIKDVKMDELIYNPSGSTALLDSVGIILDEYKNEDNVILFVATDGEENSSTKYTSNMIKDKIIKIQREKNWKIHYIGANVNAWNISTSLGIQHYTQSSESTPLHPNIVRATSINITHYRSLHSQSVNNDDYNNWIERQEALEEEEENNNLNDQSNITSGLSTLQIPPIQLLQRETSMNLHNQLNTFTDNSQPY